MSDLRYFPMLRKLKKDFRPKEKGVLSGDEVTKIKELLHIEELTIVDLQNLRDMTVLFLEDMDIISGVTTVIDTQIWNLGGEV